MRHTSFFQTFSRCCLSETGLCVRHRLLQVQYARTHYSLRKRQRQQVVEKEKNPLNAPLTPTPQPETPNNKTQPSYQQILVSWMYKKNKRTFWFLLRGD